MNTLRPEMVKYAKEHGVLDVYFNTNAMFLDENMSRKLIEQVWTEF